MLWVYVLVHTSYLAVVEAANLCHLAITATVEVFAGNAYALSFGNHSIKAHIVHANYHGTCLVVDDELLVYVAALVVCNDNAFDDDIFGNLFYRVTRNC